MNTFGLTTIPFGSTFGSPDIWLNTPMEDLLRPTQSTNKTWVTHGLMNVDVVEGPNDFSLFCDVPGVAESDIDMSYDEDFLTIRAKRTPHAIGTKHRAEREFGNLQRKVRLPVECNKDSAKACVCNGE